MKQLLFFIISSITVLTCGVEQKVDSNFVVNKYKEHSDQIFTIEYNVQRIDTFASGDVWNNTGYALIEKNNGDDLFGFSFYGKRNDVPQGILYDEGIGYIISQEDKSYEASSEAFGFLGLPGGQMVYQNVFMPDTTYRSLEVVEEDDKYIVNLQYEDDTVYNVTNITYSIELDKGSLLPVKVTRRTKVHGNKAVRQMIFSNVKVNNEVTNSINQIKMELADLGLKVTQPKTREVVVGKAFHPVKLPDLLNESQSVELEFDRLTLIDFWEVWCGPCIKSMPEVDKLKNKYDNELQVVGIMTENSENAKKLVDKKGVSFMNLIGSKGLLKDYHVDSWPRYLLVAENGIILKEYFGFSEQIEKDIATILKQ